MRRNIEAIVNICQKLLIIAILFFVPLFFNFLFITNNIYDVNKIILFKELIYISLLFFCFSILIKSKLPLIRLKESYLLGLWLLFIVFSTLSSQNMSLSFFGSYERDQGFITQLCYLIFTFLLLVFSNLKNINKYIFAAVFTSFLAGIYTLIQASGFDHLINDASFERFSSTIGQPNFLGQFLLLTIWFPIYLFFRTKNNYFKLFYFIVFLTDFSAVFLTYSRATWAGLLLGFLLTVAAFLVIEKPWGFIRNNLFKISLLFVLIFCFCSVLIFENENFALRFNNALDYKKSSLSVRFTFWGSSADMIKQRPFFGYGLENTADKFSGYYKKDWGVLGYVNQYPDRAHNFIIDAILCGGFIGFIFFAIFFIFIFYVIFQNIRKNRNKLLNFICLASLSSYLISLFFSFQVISDGVYFWFIVALVIISSRQDDEKQADSPSLDLADKKIQISVKIFVFLFLIPLLWLVRMEFKKLLADFYLNEFRVASSQGDINAAVNIYDLIKQNSYYRQSHYDNLIVYYYASMLDEDIDVKTKNRIMEILENMESCQDSQGYENKKKEFLIYSSLAVFPRPDNEYKIKAEKTLEQLVKEKREMPAVYRLGARYYCNTGELEKSVEYSQKALSFLPDLKTEETNFDHENNIRTAYYFVYRELGECYFKNKKYELAEENYRAANGNIASDVGLFKKIADTFALRGEYDQAIYYLQQGIRRDPSDHAWPYAIAQLYAIQNNEKMALPFAEKALSLSPDDQEIINFIKKLKTN